MMTEAERKLILDLELMYDEWLYEWGERVRNDTQPTREDERKRLLKLKKIITDHVGVNLETLEGYLK